MGNLPVSALFQEAMDVCVLDLLQGIYFTLLLKKYQKKINVCFVGLDSVFGKTFLRNQIVEK